MYLREERSQREIAGITGIDRKTVRKYIKEYEEKKIQIEQSDDSIHTGELIQDLVEAPKYNSSGSRNCCAIYRIIDFGISFDCFGKRMLC